MGNELKFEMPTRNELKLWYSVNFIKQIERSVSLILGNLDICLFCYISLL